MAFWRALVAQRHALELIQESTPVFGQHLCVLYTLSSPVLVPSTDMVLCRLEGDEFVADAFLDENGAIMLLNNGFFVLSGR